MTMTDTTHKQSAMCAKTLDKCPTPAKCLGANVCDRYDGPMDAKEMLRLLRDHNLHYSRQSEAAKVLEALTLSISEASIDAQRYRFIRYHSPSYFEQHWNAPKCPNNVEIDAAIDRAMREEAPK
jgi:hypothetical protein